MGPADDRFYVAIPAATSACTPKNTAPFTPLTQCGPYLAVVSPVSATVEADYATPSCSPSGVTIDETNQRIFANCGVNPQGSIVVDALSGQLISRVQQVSGSDEIWYDSGTNNVYYGASGLTSDENPVATTSPTNFATPAVGVVNAGGRGMGRLPVWLQNVPEGATTTNTHSVAADPNNGQVFVPIAGVGIQVLSNQPRT